MKYFLQLNGQTVGPFEPQELLAQGANLQSPVWCEGMPNWTLAKDVPELAQMMMGSEATVAAQPNFQASQQPQAPQAPQQSQYQQQYQQPQQPQYPHQPYTGDTYNPPAEAPAGILPVFPTLIEGLMLGVKNVASLIGAVALWAVTCWIPYLNVGTTVALLSIPVELSKGRVLNPAFIFRPVYRKYMGQFFLFCGLVFMAMLIGYSMLVIPAIVLSFSWYISFYLMFDKGLNAMDALSKSNEFTYGYKWKIFLIKFLFSAIYYMVFGMVVGMFVWIAFAAESEVLLVMAILLSIAAFLIYLTALLGVDAIIYRELLKRDDVEL